MEKIHIHRLKQKTTSSALKQLTLPPDTSIANISSLLLKQEKQKETKQKYAKVKDILSLLGTGAAISAVILAPKSAVAIKPFLNSSRDWEVWKHFNISYLQRALKRLEEQKDVEIGEENGEKIIRLTKNGKRKILRYSLTKLAIDKPKRWDGRWRLVLYDVPARDKTLGDMMRQALRTLGFYPIQESVYLTPYPCFEQVEFLREYYRLGDNVQYMVVEHVERDAALKTYFSLS